MFNMSQIFIGGRRSEAKHKQPKVAMEGDNVLQSVFKASLSITSVYISSALLTIEGEGGDRLIILNFSVL